MQAGNPVVPSRVLDQERPSRAFYGTSIKTGYSGWGACHALWARVKGCREGKGRVA